LDKILSSTKDAQEAHETATTKTVYVMLKNEDLMHIRAFGGLSAPFFGTSQITQGSELFLELQLPTECIQVVEGDGDVIVYLVCLQLVHFYTNSGIVPFKCIKQLYHLDKDMPGLPGNLTDKLSLPKNKPMDTPNMENFCEIRITSTKQYYEKFRECFDICKKFGLFPVIHSTQKVYGESIWRNGLRMSRVGQKGGGVYFSSIGPGHHRLGSPEYENNLLTENYGEDRAKGMIGKGMADLVIIVAAPAESLGFVSRSRLHA
jgi:hypothetical protein